MDTERKAVVGSQLGSREELTAERMTPGLLLAAGKVFVGCLPRAGHGPHCFACLVSFKSHDAGDVLIPILPGEEETEAESLSRRVIGR